jgi:uncharacterized UBP type Zn finger protein
VQQYRFIKFPKSLCIVLSRFVYDDWVPKKLEIELQMPEGAPIDFEKYRSVSAGKIKDGEEPMPEAEVPEESEPELDANLLNMVI